MENADFAKMTFFGQKIFLMKSSSPAPTPFGVQIKGAGFDFQSLTWFVSSVTAFPHVLPRKPRPVKVTVLTAGTCVWLGAEPSMEIL